MSIDAAMDMVTAPTKSESITRAEMIVNKMKYQTESVGFPTGVAQYQYQFTGRGFDVIIYEREWVNSGVDTT